MDRLHDDSATCASCGHIHDDPFSLGLPSFGEKDPESACKHPGCGCTASRPVSVLDRGHVTCSLCGKQATRFFTSCWGGGPICADCHEDD